MKARKLNLIGQRFDKLLVIALVERTKSGSLWLCRCDCGQEIIKLTTQLRRLNENSKTGCLQCERKSRSDANTRHGGCKFGKSKLYMIWKSMCARCSLKRNKNSSWLYYGYKGIRVCEEWKAFENFQKWSLTNGYHEGLSIDRRNPLGNYESNNCEWVTRSENSQRRNRVSMN